MKFTSDGSIAVEDQDFNPASTPSPGAAITPASIAGACIVAAIVGTEATSSHAGTHKHTEFSRDSDVG